MLAIGTRIKGRDGRTGTIAGHLLREGGRQGYRIDWDDGSSSRVGIAAVTTI